MSSWLISDFYSGSGFAPVFNFFLDNVELDLVWPVARYKARNAEEIKERLDGSEEVIPVEEPCGTPDKQHMRALLARFFSLWAIRQ